MKHWGLCTPVWHRAKARRRIFTAVSARASAISWRSETLRPRHLLLEWASFSNKPPPFTERLTRSGMMCSDGSVKSKMSPALRWPKDCGARASHPGHVVRLAPYGDIRQGRSRQCWAISHKQGTDAGRVRALVSRFSRTTPQGREPLPARAGIAHLYFESIHPFKDGNGLIGRAVAE